ncbi:MAG: glycerate kinase [Promethearchaeota archaeon]
MIIKNFNDLISNVKTEQEIYARKTILELLDIGINSVLPRHIIPRSVQLENGNLIIQNFVFNLSKTKNIYVVGAGKASGAMAEELEQILSSYITNGLINIPEGTKKNYKTQKIKFNEASHPIPSKSGIIGTQKMVKMLKDAQKNDLIIVLLSGGGSSLLTYQVKEINLNQIQILNELLIKSGATIQEINIVRKHCSKIKGGQLAKLGYPATIITLILSDIIGNPLDSIASGPTVPDPSTYGQAINILKKYHIWELLDGSIQQHLKNGLNRIVPETPKPFNKIFSKTYTIIIGDIKIACESIKQAANQKGFKSYIYSSEIIGETRNVGKNFLQDAKKMYHEIRFDQSKPIILIAGGETTVTVKGEGIGGRLQEMGLVLISEFQNLPEMVFAAMGTDGIDGFTDVAGVIIDRHSAMLMRHKKIDNIKFLNNNDSYHFFKKLGDSLIVTGPTGTNVNDLMIIGIF